MPKCKGKDEFRDFDDCTTFKLNFTKYVGGQIIQVEKRDTQNGTNLQKFIHSNCLPNNTPATKISTAAICSNAYYA